jgi:AcrR family transcriptional regulator
MSQPGQAASPQAATRSRKSVGEGNAATRTAILDTAERLFAEQGVQAVSNRQIGAAAGRGDSSVVGYYFASKSDLVQALLRRSNVELDRMREQMMAEGVDPDLRAWVRCLVLPYTDLMESAGAPGWHARFTAQVLADPTLREIAVQEATTPAVQRLIQGLRDCLADVPPDVERERTRIASQVMVHACADRERALAEGLPVSHATWRQLAAVIVDALVGLLGAPVTSE